MDRYKADTLNRRALTKIGQLERLAAVVRLPRPLNAVIELVIAQIFDVVPAQAAAIWLYDAENDRWYIGGGKGLSRRASEISFKSDETLHARVGELGEIVDTLKSTGFRRIYPEHELIKVALYAPMTIAGRRVGLIALYRHSEDRFTDDDLRFVRTVGSHIGMAISFAALEAHAERNAVLEERARLGADLHDGILQILAAVRVYAEELRSIVDGLDRSAPEAGAGAIDEVLTGLEGCVESGSAEIAAAIDHLRRPQPTVDIAGHVDAVRRRLEERGIRTTVTCRPGDLAHEVADALAWILREASSNVLRHSLAERVTITLLRDGEDIVMTVADDGVGATAPTSEPPPRGSDLHIGRRIMRERAAHVGGTLEVSRSHRGTIVRARMPAVPVLSAGPAAGVP